MRVIAGLVLMSALALGVAATGERPANTPGGEGVTPAASPSPCVSGIRGDDQGTPIGGFLCGNPVPTTTALPGSVPAGVDVVPAQTAPPRPASATATHTPPSAPVLSGAAPTATPVPHVWTWGPLPPAERAAPLPTLQVAAGTAVPTRCVLYGRWRVVVE